MLKQKILCFVLLFIFLTSLNAGGVSFDIMCSAECCLPNRSSGMHHAVGEPMKSRSDCHSNSQSIPCDFQTGKTAKLPEYTLTTSSNTFPNVVGSIDILSGSGFDTIAFQCNALIRAVDKKLQSFPIYLQIRSLLL